jgi:hypothetical protein
MGSGQQTIYGSISLSGEVMIIELIGTWLLVGFVTAIGWGTAQKVVVEPYVNPAIEKVMPQPQNPQPTNPDNK